MTLEWVGTIPGKRESRRFEGDYMHPPAGRGGTTRFDDVVAHGGWAVDLHPADGVYSELSGCTQWHSKGVYGIPWRCYYSRNVKNLFLAGRIISATHVAFGSTRVMATCAAGGRRWARPPPSVWKQTAMPADLSSGEKLRELQVRLQRDGQFLPGKVVTDPADLSLHASASASSRCVLRELTPNKAWVRLDSSWAMLVPLAAGTRPTVSFEISAEQAGVLRVELRRSDKIRKLHARSPR
jgi:hypothetical protein